MINTPLFIQGLEKLPFQSEELPVHSVKTHSGDIRFLMFGETTEFRVRTFFTKEPETLSWIDGFDKGDVLWDIGANMGCYSVYAANRKDLKVCAFEPSPVNFWLLGANVALNDFSDRISLYPFALSDVSGVIHWSLDIKPSSADNQLTGSGRAAIQTYSIDELIAIQAAPFPYHIKLDVDGIEALILAGAKKTLGDNRLKSLLVEVDEGDKITTDNIVDLLIGQGFNEPVRRHLPYFDNNHYLPFSNYLFTRNKR